MVSRETRRAVALAGNRRYESARVAIRRGIMADDADAPEADEDQEPVGTSSKVPADAPARVKRGRHSRPYRGRRLAAWVAMVVLIGALVTAAVQGWQWNQQRRLDGARQQALAAARQTTVNFVSISAATVDRDLQRVADGATGDFKDEFTRSMPQVRAAVVENKVDSRGTVLRAAIVTADRSSAVILVAVDATVHNVNAPDGRLAHYRIRVNLAQVNNVWLVSTLEFVG